MEQEPVQEPEKELDPGLDQEPVQEPEKGLDLGLDQEPVQGPEKGLDQGKNVPVSHYHHWVKDWTQPN
jgi:hypothetical protein